VFSQLLPENWFPSIAVIKKTPFMLVFPSQPLAGLAGHPPPLGPVRAHYRASLK